MHKIKLGTRKSKLALAQANIAADIILKKTGIECELVHISTSGDKEKIKALYDIGGKGLFIKELEEALLNKKIDIAVHSLKDVPGIIDSSLKIAAMLEREDPRDVLVSKIASKISDIPKGARIGSSSPRRIIYIKKQRPDLEIEILRGNIDSRYQKILNGELDVIILAYAGLKRLYGKLDENICHPIEYTEMLPAIGQGVIALEIRKEDDKMQSICTAIDHHITSSVVIAERSFLEYLEASCRTPAAAFARQSGADEIEIDFMLAKDDMQDIITRKAKGAMKDSYIIGKRIAEEMKQNLYGNN